VTLSVQKVKARKKEEEATFNFILKMTSTPQLTLPENASSPKKQKENKRTNLSSKTLGGFFNK
jgi:hypothetical protein